MSSNIKKKSLNATIWSGIDSLSRQVVTLIINIVLARLLMPADFGLIGMLTLFISLSNVFIECGFSNALIRKVDRDENDNSTAFFFNIIVGVIAYIILIFIAPYVSKFYNEPLLESLLYFIGLNVIINSFCIVQNALLVSEFNIKLQAKIQISSQIVTGIIAIICAYLGLGVWALAIQSVGSTLMRAVLLWLYTKWHPCFTFSRYSFEYLWNFGSKMLLTGLISTFFNEIYSIIIGKQYTKESLGYYTRANHFAVLIPGTLTSIIQKVTLPTLAQFQDNKIKLLDVYRKYIHVIAFMSIPIMFLLSALSEPLIKIILSDKWIDSIILLKILAIGQSFAPIGSINMSILQVLNKTSYTLKLEVIKKILFTFIISITFFTNIKVLVIGYTIYNIIATFINTYCSKKFINYKYKDQFMDIFKYLISSVIMFIIVLFTISIIENLYFQLFIGGLFGIISYLIQIKLFKLDAYNIIINLIKDRT